MFNMQQIGRKISSLRKERNMTQMELADKLNISFQAVSNWERCNSMPDISKLPELADIFQISVDELLGEKSLLVEAAINDNIAECMENNQISEDEVSNVLPILKPNQVGMVIEKADNLNWNNIAGFLPFMYEDDVKEFAVKAMEEGKGVTEFLPFMLEDDVKEFAVKAMEEGKGATEFLPFMYEDDVKEFAVKAMEEGKGVTEFLPFMLEDDVKEFAVKAMEEGKAITKFLPFMHENDVKELAIRCMKK